MISNYGEFAIIKVWIGNLLPYSKKLQCVSISKPIRNKEITILGLKHIRNADIVLRVDLLCSYFYSLYN